MNRSIRHTAGHRAVLVLCLSAGLLLGTEAMAQQRSLTGSESSSDAYLQRQLRSLEQRDSGTSPESAAIQLERARRDLVGQSGGVAFTPEQARISRGLDSVQRDLQRQRLEPSTTQPLARPRGDALPSSTGDVH